jgi:hypothetical protein
MDSISIPDSIAPLDGFDETREQPSLRRALARKKPSQPERQGPDAPETGAGPEEPSIGLDELA